tara:strand:+ start:134455 stop:135288 length:834 start_codon:yes stop_codon:yes gene_type:complete
MAYIKSVMVPGTSPAIHVREAGSGPCIILLHGIGGNSNNWESQLNVLSSKYTAIAWDMRGYGLSEDYTGPLRLEDLCDDIDAVLGFYRSEQAHLVGLSMGGMIAQEYYRRRPEKVKSLVLANTNTGLGVEFNDEQKHEFINIRKNPLQHGLETSDLIPSMIGALVGRNAPQAAIDNICASIASLRKESYIKAIEAIVEMDSSDITHLIDPPVLLIGSSDDRVIPASSLAAMHEKIPCSELHILDGVGHLSNLERPAEFNALMLEFYDNQASGKRKAI